MGKNLAEVEAALRSMASKLDTISVRRQGEIVINVIGDDAGSIVLNSTHRTTEIAALPSTSTPLVEVTAVPDKLKELLDGKKDAREVFVEGGIRVRGDIAYIENVLKELGLMK